MCACRQKKSFLIADILGDTRKKPYKNLSHEPSKPLVCSKKAPETVYDSVATEPNNYEDYGKIIDTKSTILDTKSMALDTKSKVDTKLEDNLTRFNVIAEVQYEMDLSKVNLEHRRNTYPIHPTPVKPNYPWNYRGKDSLGYMEPRMSYYSEQMLNTSQLLRSQLAANRFVSHPFAIRQSYGFDRGK